MSINTRLDPSHTASMGTTSEELHVHQHEVSPFTHSQYGHNRPRLVPLHTDSRNKQVRRAGKVKGVQRIARFWGMCTRSNLRERERERERETETETETETAEGQREGGRGGGGGV